MHHSLHRQLLRGIGQEVPGAASGQSQPPAVTGLLVAEASMRCCIVRGVCLDPYLEPVQQLLPAGPPKWKGPPGAIPPKGAIPKAQPAQGAAGTIQAHQGSVADRYLAMPVNQGGWGGGGGGGPHSAFLLAVVCSPQL